MGHGLGVRVARLRALIDHPNTGVSERAAAQRMLDRILAKSGAGMRGGAADQRIYGARFDRAGRHADLERIVEMIRADIVFARTFSAPGAPTELALISPLRDCPEEISFSVEAPFDGRIVITIEGVPQAWGWTRDSGVDSVSPRLQALADELAEILNGYNYDGADVGKRFFGSVRVGDVTLVW
ncbi:hypothetical protein [Nocardia arthritidis]|uniref:Uncharacterized protein n=1 Tax=Nocardia arthritidis TaxID=228602 RepID=A0A6G9YJW9_9NOCA|nr:hypothetical protein [Nocardia arthritidis]QIS13595.1 hypothetical protein F5544_28720 [Nocardia arthritidis]